MLAVLLTFWPDTDLNQTLVYLGFFQIHTQVQAVPHMHLKGWTNLKFCGGVPLSQLFHDHLERSTHTK